MGTYKYVSVTLSMAFLALLVIVFLVILGTLSCPLGIYPRKAALHIGPRIRNLDTTTYSSCSLWPSRLGSLLNKGRVAHDVEYSRPRISYFAELPVVYEPNRLLTGFLTSKGEINA